MHEYLLRCGKHYDEIMSRTRIKFNPTNIYHFTDKSNIDFDVESSTCDDMDWISFNTLINEELRLRRMDLHGTLQEKRLRLRGHLLVEQRLASIRAAIKRSRLGKEAALILIKQAIPCIMHLENRVGEKLLSLLLSQGAIRYQKDRNCSSLDGYVQAVQNIVCTQILGTRRRPKQ
jgi:hypothetical protein